MSPRVTRKSTSVYSSHQRQSRKSINDAINDEPQQGSSETLQKVSISKAQKPHTSIKRVVKQNQKSPVADPVHSDITSSADEMPLNNRLSARRKVLVKKPATSAVTNPSTSRNEVFKRPLTSIDNQKSISKQSRPKRARNEEEVCKEFFEKCNKQTLFKVMVQEFDAEEILKGYKEKRNDWNKEEIQKEASRVLDINLENPGSKDVKSRMASLQKVLKELSNLVESGDEFAEMVLKTYGRQLKSEKIFDLLELDDLKRAILKKFTANDMLGLFSKTDNTSVVKQILEMASVDTIIDILKLRNNLDTSQKLLKVSLEMLSEITPEPTEQTQEDPTVTSNLQAGLSDAIVDAINSKKYLKTSEVLLNFMLQNVMEVQSKETKKNFVNFLINKFSSDERNDISHEVIKSILNQNKKGISLIDLSD